MSAPKSDCSLLNVSIHFRISHVTRRYHMIEQTILLYGGPCHWLKGHIGGRKGTDRPGNGAVPFSLVMILLLHGTSSADSLVLRKCCPADEALDRSLECSPMPERTIRGEFDWFPASAVVGGTARLPADAAVLYGAKPECDTGETDAVTFNDTDRQFAFILDDGELRAHVSSGKTLHDPGGFGENVLFFADKGNVFHRVSGRCGSSQIAA